jgi:hypothetical protein
MELQEQAVTVSTKKAISVKAIPEDLWRAFRVEAMKRGVTTQELLISIIRDSLPTLKKKTA